jgi:hypothetical protein
MKLATTAKGRVERGARWLDENFVGWESRINLDTLDLASGQSCICGQVFRRNAMRNIHLFRRNAMRNIHLYADGYDYAATHLFAEANSWISELVPKSSRERANRVAINLGFMSDDRIWFGELQDEWKALLRDRRDGKKFTSEQLAEGVTA